MPPSFQPGRQRKKAGRVVWSEEEKDVAGEGFDADQGKIIEKERRLVGELGPEQEIRRKRIHFLLDAKSKAIRKNHYKRKRDKRKVYQKCRIVLELLK